MTPAPQGESNDLIHAGGRLANDKPVMFNLSGSDLSGAPFGIRTRQHPLDSASYRFYNAAVTANASDAVAPCPLLPASTAGNRIEWFTEEGHAKALVIGIVRVHDELERASVEQSHGGEVANVSRRKATNTEIVREHDDRRVD